MLRPSLSRPSWVWRISVAAAFAVMCGFGAAQLPALGTGDHGLTPAAERRLGDRIVRELYRDPDFLEDAVLQEHVDSLWQALLAAARQRRDLPPDLDDHFAWTVLLSRDRGVNAFALPGGWFGVHAGLIALTGSADELASVLAHELSHSTQRHIPRLLARQERQAPWLLGAMILGALAAAKNPDAANAVLIGGQAVAAQQQLNFSRDMEREADRVGFAVMAQAGFSPEGFVSMFERLAQSSRLTDSGAYPYLRSHPLTSERLADMRSRLAQADMGAGMSRPRAAAGATHALIAARARVLSGSGIDALRVRVDEGRAALASAADPKNTREARAAALYGAALAAGRLGDHDIAQHMADALAPLLTGDTDALRLLSLLQAELALAAGRPQRAQAALDAAADSRPVRLARAQAALALGDPAGIAEAAGPLESLVAAQPRDAVAWRLLAQLRQQQGRGLQAIRADAEAQAARLDYAAAIERLRAAQSLPRAQADPGQHIDLSIIDARRRVFESALREQALER